MADEGTPLVAPGARAAPSSRLARLNRRLLAAVDRVNPIVTTTPKRLFEICDQSIYPPFLRRRCQAMLAAEWTHRLPLIQHASPADMAASLIVKALDELKDDGSSITVVDFCSGGGGPVPVIERLVNKKRAERNKPPIPFKMTDIKPHIDAWMTACARSPNLSYFPQPVDATDPPPAVMSTTVGPASGVDAQHGSKARVFRLYCLAFHHFPDDLARKVLESTTNTSDGFAILELQDRRLASLFLMFLDFWLMFVVTIFWFWDDPLQLLFTYLIPVLPFTLSFDGCVSSLRTRTFIELMALVDSSLESALHGPQGRVARRVLQESGTAEIEGWVFKGGREMHTWPIGYMNYIVGRRVNDRH
ncbi:uncharacterized protein BKCO1_1400025 [Diplodia corticola]|uniref:Uncharacterized protein n=1 Tax=Diplodia corticola TaxID=236234 RepID=A0A1J9S8H0_9PEZI|nr:uncharacterized protein BKCO1_1400025 [Diplodia corticola]OJD35877.1 hypothetical protein BKCO1_1400025 [Diplodia corticola]